VLGGTLSVTCPEGAIEEPTGNTARLLALLVSRADQPVSITEISRAVWPDVDPDLVSQQQVERLVAGLRHLLGEGARDVIPFRKHDRYRLDASSGPIWVDSVEFDHSARAAQASLESGDADRARDLAVQALALWEGDPVVLPDEWEALRQLRCRARIVAAQAAMLGGDHRQAAIELAAFVDENPDDEAAWTLLVEARLGSGDRVLAAQACEQATERFERYGGMGPKLADLCRPLTPAPASEPSAPEVGIVASTAASAAAVRAPSPRPEPPSRTRRVRTGVRVGAALVVALAVGVTYLLTEGSSSNSGPRPVTVYNLEANCQGPRTRVCRLGLARDPYANYTPSNVVAHVWHGDRLRADCFVADGSRIESEDGRPSTRWYRVTVPRRGSAPRRATQAWLPAVRVRAGTDPDVPACA
jgi:DNA-binding SARP family transcriptional activator